MKAWIWFIRIVLSGLLLTCIAANGLLFYSRTVKGEELPALFGYGPLTVDSSEMIPSLYPGDCAILRLGAESEPGDIVVFRRSGALLLRRVVGTSDGQYIVQQEDFGQPDVDLLDPAQVQGVCVTYLPGCGTAVEFFHSPFGLAVQVLLLLLLLAVPLFRTRGEPRLEGPAVDYGGEDPYTKPQRTRSPSISPAVYFEEDLPLSRRLEPPPDPEPAPPEPIRRKQEPARREAAPPARTPAARRSGSGSHYKPRH